MLENVSPLVRLQVPQQRVYWAPCQERVVNQRTANDDMANADTKKLDIFSDVNLFIRLQEPFNSLLGEASVTLLFLTQFTEIWAKS